MDAVLQRRLSRCDAYLTMHMITRSSLRYTNGNSTVRVFLSLQRNAHGEEPAGSPAFWSSSPLPRLAFFSVSQNIHMQPTP